MNRWLLVLLALAVAATPVWAGRNANGAMVVHTDNGISYTSMNYCPHPVPGVCTDLVTTSTKLPEEEVAVIFLLAAFPPQSSPAVTTIQFGIQHNLPPGLGYFAGFSACGPNPLELPDAGWPESNSVGNLIAYSAPVYSSLFKFYWFAVYGVDSGYFETRTYPTTNEAKFVDDGSPPLEDLCTRFGRIQWGSPGYNACPINPPPAGACCFVDGSCQVLASEECAALGGSYQGDGSVCQPNPCPQPEACCLPTGACEMLLPSLCEQQQGQPQGPGTDCNPNPCIPPFQACCLPDGSCQYILPDECAQQGGDAMGEGTVCEGVQCPGPTGACCLTDNECVIASSAECESQGGVYMGDGISCDPNPCQIPTQETSWGRLRSMFR